MSTKVRKLFLIVPTLVLMFLVSWPYWHSQMPSTHDGQNHLARFANYKLALRQGQFPPRFAPNLMNNYGYPVFNYNYPLANILSLPFSIIKVNPEWSFRWLLWLSFIVGAVGVWQWGKQMGWSRNWSFIGILFLASAPPLLNIILVRGNIGEWMALLFLPWLCWWIELCKKSEEPTWQQTSIAAIVHLAFLLSHNVTVLITAPVLFILTLTAFGKSWSKWRAWIMPGIWACFASFWFWLPALLEKDLVAVTQGNLSSQYVQHFPRLKQLLFAPLQFGYSYPGPVDSLSFSLGAAQWLVLFIGIGLVVAQLRVRKRLPRWGVYGLVALMLVFLQTSSSQEIWKRTPAANLLQFPWRLSLWWVIVIVPVGVSVLKAVPKIGQIILMAVILLQLTVPILYQPPSRFHQLNADYDHFSQSTTTSNENRPIGFSYENIGDWKAAPSILVGSGEVNAKSWNGTERQYNLELPLASIVTEPTMAFAGWETYIKEKETGKEFKIPYIDNEVIQGRLAYQLPAGKYEVHSRFTQHTAARQVGNGLSFLTVIAGLMWLLLTLYHQRGNERS